MVGCNFPGQARQALQSGATGVLVSRCKKGFRGSRWVQLSWIEAHAFTRVCRSDAQQQQAVGGCKKVQEWRADRQLTKTFSLFRDQHAAEFKISHARLQEVALYLLKILLDKVKYRSVVGCDDFGRTVLLI